MRRQTTQKFAAALNHTQHSITGCINNQLSTTYNHNTQTVEILDINMTVQRNCLNLFHIMMKIIRILTYFGILIGTVDILPIILVIH